VLGVTIEGGTTLVVRPCVPDAWPGFRVRRRLPDGTTYVIEVTAPSAGGPSECVVAATVDQVAVPIKDGAARIGLARDGAVHDVAITLGPRRAGVRRA
jgi:N,N'-diacetylchitobiose phosphorylase